MSAAERKLLVIAGPTASGKTELALALAAKFPLRLISADSMQVYRGMDIGTAKPAERSRFALIDVADPGEGYSAGRFMREASALCEEAWAAGQAPCITGGSGLYIRALLQGLVEVPPIPAEIRASVEAMPHAQRVEELDAETAAKTELQNPRRVSRALEVLKATGKGLAAWQRENHQPGPALGAMLGFCLDPGPDILGQRIQSRLQASLAQGWASEARALAVRYGAEAVKSTGAIGYAELLEMPESEAAPLIDLRTRQYARRQRTWFRRERGLKWAGDISNIESDVGKFL